MRDQEYGGGRSLRVREHGGADSGGAGAAGSATRLGISAQHHRARSKLNAADLYAMADPLVRARLADLGLQFPLRDEQTPAALGALQKAEIEKWWPIITAAGIKAE